MPSAVAQRIAARIHALYTNCNIESARALVVTAVEEELEREFDVLLARMEAAGGNQSRPS